MESEFKKKLRSCESSEALSALLQTIEPDTLTPRDIEFIHHVIEKVKPERHYKVAYLANHTIDALPRYTNVWCATQGYFVDAYIGAFNQFFQEILDTESGLHKSKPDMIFLSLLMRELAPQVANSFSTLSRDQRKLEISRIVEQLTEWAELAKTKTEATLLLSNFARPTHAQAGVADMQLDMGEAEFYAELNLSLLQTFREDQRVYIFDTDHVLSRYGKNRSYDAKMYHLAKIEWDEAVLPQIASEIWRYIRAATGNTRKCLVLDLDNTMWGGIVGEDGVHGIKIGHGDAQSEAYLEFQHTVRFLLERGVILAICSKNNAEDVDEVFAERGEMVLKKDDFSSVKVNWDYKYLNIQEIANEINIGLDSIVFVDDNPVECSLVTEALPEVKTVHLSGDPSQFANTLMQLTEFEKLFITSEDKAKRAQYQQNEKRQQQKQSFGNIDEYLQSLGTKVHIEKASEKNIARIHQLFTKTNQFNVTTKRYTLSDIETFIKENNWSLNVVQVQDNYGDLGIVGLYLIETTRSMARIDSFVLSCRALGRGIETFIMNNIKQSFLRNGACSTLQSQFIQTAKNKPAAPYFTAQGFVKTEGDEQQQHYELTSDQNQLLACPGIEMQIQEEK